jgi:phosphoribosylglycinamide formyltransferase-1
MKKKIVSFLVSGRGSNFTAVAEKIINGEIKAGLGIVISDKGEAKALEIAEGFGMKAFHVDPKQYASREEHEKEMERLLKDSGTDLVVAAGYMRVLTPYFVKCYRNRIINIHPAILPSFPGTDAQKQAFDYGVKITGCTAHFIDEGTDTGPIIMQAAVEVTQDETLTQLSARILKEEHRILPESVKLFCEERLTVAGNKVLIKQ